MLILRQGNEWQIQQEQQQKEEEMLNEWNEKERIRDEEESNKRMIKIYKKDLKKEFKNQKNGKR